MKEPLERLEFPDLRVNLDLKENLAADCLDHQDAMDCLDGMVYQELKESLDFPVCLELQEIVWTGLLGTQVYLALRETGVSPATLVDPDHLAEMEKKVSLLI